MKFIRFVSMGADPGMTGGTSPPPPEFGAEGH